MNEMKGAIPVVLDKLAWMREQRIWPNGLRYLWTEVLSLNQEEQ